MSEELDRALARLEVARAELSSALSAVDAVLDVIEKRRPPNYGPMIEEVRSPPEQIAYLEGTGRI